MKKKILMGALALSTVVMSSCDVSSQTPTVFEAAADKTASTWTVTRDKDGDTFEIAVPNNPFPNLSWSVRVLGIDTPEKGYLAKCSREKDRALKASAMAADLIDKSGKQVTLKKVKWDKYGGRIDAEVYLSDGSNFGQHLIDAGLAKPYNGNGPKPNWCY